MLLMLVVTKARRTRTHRLGAALVFNLLLTLCICARLCTLGAKRARAL